MHKSTKILSTIASLLFLISILLGIIFTCSFNHSFYQYEYDKSNQAEVIGMSDKDLTKATDTLLDYLENKRDDIVVEATVCDTEREVFNERETLHMVDVKNLCMHAKMAAIGMFAASIVLYVLIYLKEKKEAMHVYMSGIRYALLMIVLFVSMLAIYALCDFYDFWMNFHYLFFDNDLFILDPNTSIMINIVLYEPEIPANTGNIMRTCMAFHMRLHLIEPLGFSLDEKHLRRAGMDYVKELDYKTYPDWETFLKTNQGSFYFVSRYALKTPDSFDYTKDEGDIYLVFGKESTGIPKDILYDHLDKCMRIPMVKEARSLNLSNCVALVSYEVLRQLDYPELCKHESIKGEDYLERVHNASTNA